MDLCHSDQTTKIWLSWIGLGGTVDMLMEEILHQLIGSHIIYRVLSIPGGVGFLPSTVLENFGLVS